MTINYLVTPVSNYGGANGKIQLTVTGGVAPFTYSWSNGETSKDLQKLKAGTYEVKVTDSNPYRPVSNTVSIEVGQPEFLCGRDSVPDIDGNKYPTVKIGEQCWFAENLRTIHELKPDGKKVEIEGVYCQGTNCRNSKGAHYTWNAAVGDDLAGAVSGNAIQGVCPDGWQVPSLDLWQDLENYLRIDGNGGPGINVASKLRGAESASGFDAIYANAWGYDPVPTAEYAAFWATNEFVPAGADPDAEIKNAYFRAVNELSVFQRGTVNKSSGLSIRCIKTEF
jgi:uncharacterized protein (TIGR02145 family)